MVNLWRALMKSAIIRLVATVLFAAGLLAGLAGPGHAQFVLYDDFSSGFIRPGLWEGISLEGNFSAPTAELIRAVENGALRLALVSWGDSTSDSGSVTSRQGLQVRQVGTLGGSGFITGMKARVTVLDAVVQDCPANPATLGSIRARAQVVGWFFNDTTATPSATDRSGNIIAGVQLTKEADGANQIQPFVQRCSDAACNVVTNPPVTGAGTILTTTWSPDTPLIVKVVWNQANQKFTFAVTDPATLAVETLDMVYQGVLTVMGPPTVGDFHQVRVQNSVKNCSTGRKQVATDALFDAIKVLRQP
jgi:hypothetical protein